MLIVRGMYRIEEAAGEGDFAPDFGLKERAAKK